MRVRMGYLVLLDHQGRRYVMSKWRDEYSIYLGKRCLVSACGIAHGIVEYSNQPESKGNMLYRNNISECGIYLSDDQTSNCICCEANCPMK